MAQTIVSIQFEDELIQDGINALIRVRDALRTRHGPQCRALERRIDTLGETPGALTITALEVGRFVIQPPAIWTQILAEADRLGLI